MRYRRKFRFYRIVVPTCCAAFLVGVHYFWLAVLAVVAVGLEVYIEDRLSYWEIRPDRLIDRRLVRTVVLPFSEITYVGPFTGYSEGLKRRAERLAVFKGGDFWIEVRNAKGKRKLLNPADYDGFLAEMRTHLPGITRTR
jgi:hypothetical protein